MLNVYSGRRKVNDTPPADAVVPEIRVLPVEEHAAAVGEGEHPEVDGHQHLEVEQPQAQLGVAEDRGIARVALPPQAAHGVGAADERGLVVRVSAPQLLAADAQGEGRPEVQEGRPSRRATSPKFSSTSHAFG